MRHLTRPFSICIALALFFLLTTPVQADPLGDFIERFQSHTAQVQDALDKKQIEGKDAMWLWRQARAVRLQAEIFIGEDALSAPEASVLFAQLKDVEDALSFLLKENKKKTRGYAQNVAGL